MEVGKRRKHNLGKYLERKIVRIWDQLNGGGVIKVKGEAKAPHHPHPESKRWGHMT